MLQAFPLGFPICIYTASTLDTRQQQHQHQQIYNVSSEPRCKAGINRVFEALVQNFMVATLQELVSSHILSRVDLDVFSFGSEDHSIR